MAAFEKRGRYWRVRIRRRGYPEQNRTFDNKARAESGQGRSKVRWIGGMPTQWRLVKLAWAAPCSAVGLLLGGLVLLLRGSVRRTDGTLEFAYRQTNAQCGRCSRKLPYRAITFGHVIVAVTEADLNQSRQHERVHVRQYEHWGLLFFVAYPAASAWQLLKGRRAYWDNYFEVQGRSQCERNKVKPL